MPILLSVITAASGLTSAGPHSSTLIGLAIMAVVAAGSETSVRTGWVVAAVGVLAVQIGALTYGADRGVFLGYPLVLVVALLAGHNRRAYRVRAEQAALMLEQAEQLRAQQRLTAVLDERTRLAREIHDVLAHSLGALGIQIQAARALVAQGGQEARVDDMLARAQRMAADGLTETRRAVHALRADSAPLAQALEAIAENHRQQHRAPVRVAITSPEPELPPEQNVQLVRTAQEALTNAAKHAPHQPVDITLGYEDHQVTMTVSNPFAPAPTSRRRLSSPPSTAGTVSPVSGNACSWWADNWRPMSVTATGRSLRECPDDGPGPRRADSRRNLGVTPRVYTTRAGRCRERVPRYRPGRPAAQDHRRGRPGQCA
ncbi:sensor histidine kinase [Streptomyces chiangmaiensis]